MFLKYVFSFFLVLNIIIVRSASYQTRHIGRFPIKAKDGVVFYADAVIPIPNNPTERFPLLIFSNSWAVPRFEYYEVITRYAALGYVGVEYENRGWYVEEGQIDVAGPLDRMDGSTVIDFILNNYTKSWLINETAVAFLGISYGAGIALMMAGYDSRVKTAVSLSGWGNLTQSMYQNQSPNIMSLDGLLKEAIKYGKPSREFKEVIRDIKYHQNLSFIYNYSNERSPAIYINKINARNIPIFMSNNMCDRYFNTPQSVKYWISLTSPKFFLLNNGVHAEPEAFGLILINTYIWDKVTLWLDSVLKGKKNGILEGPKMYIQQGNGIFSKDYRSIINWPKSKDFEMIDLILKPRANNYFGNLFGNLPQKKYFNSSDIQISSRFDNLSLESVYEFFHKRNNVDEHLVHLPFKDDMGYDHIDFSFNPSLSSGDNLEDIANSFGIPFYSELYFSYRHTSIVFVTPKLISLTTVCGIPSVTISFIPTFKSNGTVSHNWQIYALLYDVHEFYFGELISDSPYTHYSDQAYEKNVHFNPKTGVVTITDWELRAACRDVKPGHRIGLGFVLYDKRYLPANGTSGDLTVKFMYGLSSKLTVPIHN